MHDDTKLLEDIKANRQRAAVRRYQDKHERINVLFDTGIKQRIDNLGLGCSYPMFIRFCTEFMLNFCENGRTGDAGL